MEIGKEWDSVSLQMVKTEEGRASGVEAVGGLAKGPLPRAPESFLLSEVGARAFLGQQGRAMTTKSQVYDLLSTILMPSTVLGTFTYIAFQLILATAHWDKIIIPLCCLGNRLREAEWNSRS